MRLALGQINPTVGDLQGNAVKIIALIDEARDEKTDLVIFPELALTGYPPKTCCSSRNSLKITWRT